MTGHQLDARRLHETFEGTSAGTRRRFEEALEDSLHTPEAI